MKRCPKCGVEKDESEFFNYFSKARKKMRTGNYCKPCKRVDAVPRAKAHFEANKAQKLQYARDYRANPTNTQKLRELRNRFRKQYVEALHPCYVAEQVSRRLELPTAEVKAMPGLLEAYTLHIKLKRDIKKRTDGTK
jgi:hypothetical protein